MNMNIQNYQLDFEAWGARPFFFGRNSFSVLACNVANKVDKTLVPVLYLRASRHQRTCGKNAVCLTKVAMTAKATTIPADQYIFNSISTINN